MTSMAYIHCEVYSECTVYSIQFTDIMVSVNTEQCTFYCVWCSVLSVQFTIYSVQCTMYSTVYILALNSVQCTIYSVPCAGNSIKCDMS